MTCFNVGQRVGIVGPDPKLRQQRVVVHLRRLVMASANCARKQAEFVDGREQGVKLGLLAQAIQPHGIQPLEDVAIFAVLGRAAMLLDEIDDVLEARDDPLLARRAPAARLGLDGYAELVEQFVVDPSQPRAASALLRARKATPSAIRFSQASGEVIDGRRPRSCLNFRPACARSRASSIVSLTRLRGDDLAATCFSALLAHRSWPGSHRLRRTD